MKDFFRQPTKYIIVHAIWSYKQTFSVRACARTRTRARAAIFVHSGAGGALKVCVRVRAYTNFLVRTCADMRGPPFFYHKIFKINKI